MIFQWWLGHLVGARGRHAAPSRRKEPAELDRFEHPHFSKHDPTADPWLAGGITYLMWPGNTSESPRRIWEKNALLRRGMSGKPCFHYDLTQISWGKWMRGYHRCVYIADIGQCLVLIFDGHLIIKVVPYPLLYVQTSAKRIKPPSASA